MFQRQRFWIETFLEMNRLQSAGSELFSKFVSSGKISIITLKSYRIAQFEFSAQILSLLSSISRVGHPRCILNIRRKHGNKKIKLSLEPAVNRIVQRIPQL